MSTNNKKQQTITQAEIDEAKAKSESAKLILQDDSYLFIRDYLRQEKEKIIDEAVNNKLKKIIIKKDGHDVIYERWEQEAEQAGKFKFIFEFVSYLQQIVDYPAEIEKAILDKRLKIEE